MHMAMVIAGGILLLGVFLLFGKLWGGDVCVPQGAPENLAISSPLLPWTNRHSN